MYQSLTVTCISAIHEFFLFDKRGLTCYGNLALHVTFEAKPCNNSPCMHLKIHACNCCLCLLQVMYLRDLPDDILADVASRLRVQDIFTWRLASKYFKKRIDDFLGQIAIALEPPVGITGGRLAALCHHFPGAASLSLRNCSHSSLHDDILLILPRSLEMLSLYECSWVTSEGLSHLVQLKELKHLGVGFGCRNLEELPNDLGRLHLTLLSTSALFANPETLLDLSNLVELRIWRNRTFTAFPRDIGSSLKSLKRLSVNHCCSFEGTLGGIRDLISLTRLQVLYCPVRVIPDNISELCSLQELCLVRLDITTLPASISALQYLRGLSLIACAFLVSLPESIGALQSLTKLDLLSCKALKSLPVSLGSLSQLAKVSVKGCPQLVEFQCHGCTIEL